MPPVTVLIASSPTLVPGTATAVATRFPGVRVVEVPSQGPVDPEVAGDVLLAPFDIGLGTLVALGNRVRWVHVNSSGVDAFPLDAVAANTVVSCSRGSSARPIAEFVLALILAAEKRLPEVWVDRPPSRPFGPLADELWAADNELSNKVLGVVGLGAIGRRVAELGVAFGMGVVAVRRRSGLGGPAGVGVVPSAAQLWPLADHLVLCAALTPATAGLFGRGAIAACKPGVHLVNVGRGGLVDHDALLEGLDRGRVGRASLDVVDPEPLPEGHPLYRHPRVRISPHVAGVNNGAAARHLASFMENLEAFVAGQPLPGLVDRAAGY